MEMKVLLSEESRKKQFLKQARKAINQGKSIDILCIAGTAPLTARLNWLSDLISKEDFDPKSIQVKVTSVEASIYGIGSKNATVNHNSKIDPNEEDLLEESKNRLEALGVSLHHYSLCSEINGSKITRHMSASRACHQSLSTRLQKVLDQRYGEAAMKEAEQGTTQRDLPAALYGIEDTDDTMISHSTYAHDLKAMFVHQYAAELQNGGILVEVRRLGIPTDIGRIYFNVKDVMEENLAIVEAKCRKSLEENGKNVLSASAVIDARIVFHPDRINDFDQWFLAKLTEKNPILKKSMTVITDMGHGYRDISPENLTRGVIDELDSDPFNPCIKQDSDDHLVALELVAQQRQVHRRRDRIALVNRVVSDDCLNMRAVYEIAFALQYGSDARISVDPAKNKPLPFANADSDRQTQIMTFAESAALHLNLLPNITLDESQTRTLYEELYTNLSDVGDEIIQQAALGNVTDDLKALIAAHQSAVNALSQIPKVRDGLGVSMLVSCMRDQNQSLQQDWQSYQMKQNLKKFVSVAAMAATATVYVYEQDITWGLLAGAAYFLLGSYLVATMAEFLHPAEEASPLSKPKAA